ncbi:hypothetical protein DSLASN_44540 [Desulfoluna limicola]|uniref:Uncharacterized protein n=1 Tax=Desulfoluna limicola TaxID=2810562 RepID=A0ABM7PMX2_9BACT|nr:hypothetical protein DSLASN_44540 [Desulfoluna limicola]
MPPAGWWGHLQTPGRMRGVCRDFLRCQGIRVGGGIRQPISGRFLFYSSKNRRMDIWHGVDFARNYSGDGGAKPFW